MTNSKEKTERQPGEGKKRDAPENAPKTFDDPFVLNSVYPEAVQIFAGVLEPISSIYSSAIVVLDTNVLLVPFTVSQESLDKIAATYRVLAKQKRLVVPGQVAREFARHRANKLAELYQQMSDRKSKLMSGRFGSHPLLARISEFVALQEKEKALLMASDEYGEQLSLIVERIRTWTWNDPVSELYREIFTSDVVVDSTLNKETVAKEFSHRTAHAIPPGYKDASKPDGGVGDFIIWNTILDVGRQTKQHVLFVSGEEKSDWWHRSKMRHLFPRFELVDEFRRHSDGKSFHILSLADLLSLYGAAEELVSEVRETEQESARTQDDVPSSKVDPELNAALEKLPHDERIVFLLVEIEGFAYKEVAEILDTPVRTVRDLLSRAKERKRTAWRKRLAQRRYQLSR